MARVTVNVNVRDMTGRDLERIRNRFDGLTGSLNRFAGRTSQRNLDAMRNSFGDLETHLERLRGAIPQNEFERLTGQVQAFRTQVDRIGVGAGRDEIGRLRESLSNINNEIGRMDRHVRIRVGVDDETTGPFRAIRRRVDTLNRGIMNSFVSALQGGIGQGLARSLNAAASNPYVMAAILALATALTLQLGTALAAALTLAFGGAFIALGVMAVAGSKKVTKAFERETNLLKKRFTEAAQPLIPVLEHAAKKMGELGKSFAPEFGKAMKEAAPFLTRFLDEMARGITEFGRRGFKPMMDGFNALLEAIDWEGFFSDLGDSFGHLGAVVTQHADKVAGVFDGLLSILPKMINLIASLAAGWAKVQPFVAENWRTIKLLLTPALAVIGVLFKALTDVMMAMAPVLGLLNRALGAFYNEALVPVGNFIKSTLGPVWNGLVQGFTEGWAILEKDLVPVLRDLWQIVKDTGREILSMIPGLDGLSDKSQNAGRVIKEWIIDKMTALGQWLAEHREDIKEWGQRIADGVVLAAQGIAMLVGWLITAFKWVHENWDLILTVTGVNLIIWLIQKAGEAWGWVSRHWEIGVRTTGIGGIMSLIQWVRDAWSWVSRHWGIDVKIAAPGIFGVIGQIQTLWNWVSRSWSRNVNFHFSASGALDTIKGILGRAHGGVVGHIGTAATGGVRNNMTLVGEQGPELVNLAPGSHVRSNPDTRRIMGQGGGGGQPMIIQVMLDGNKMAEVMIDPIRNQIFNRGGNVQTVLGRGHG